MLLNMLRQTLADADFKEWRQFKVKQERKKPTSVFGFWLTAGENIDFLTQYLADNMIFGDDLVDFSFKVYLLLNTRVTKFIIWQMF